MSYNLRHGVIQRIKTIKTAVVNTSLSFVIVASGLGGALPLLFTRTASAAGGTIIINGDTAAAENNAGWMFNRDTSTQTPYNFTNSEHSTGSGSVYIAPISNASSSDKFIGELFTPGQEVSNLNSISYDFKIGSGGPTAYKQFYANIYANYAASPVNNFYDCRYNVVPSSGSTTSFTTVTFDPTTPYTVTTRSGSATCPATPSDMGAGATMRVIALNVGDTSLNDAGVSGYIDNVKVDTASAVTTYDFEGADTSSFAFVGSPKYVRANNAGDESARIIVSNQTTEARFYVDGNLTSISGTLVGPSTSTTAWWKLETPLTAGQHEITAQVKISGDWYDVNGSGVVYSLDSPWAEYVIPQANQFFRPNDKVVRIKADDEFNQFKYMKVVINSTTTTVNRADCTDQGNYVLCDVQSLNLPEGPYTAKTTTYTKANNRVDNLVSPSFTIDGTRPTLTNFVVTSPAAVYGNQVAVSADATDTNGIKNVSFYVTSPRISDAACDGNGTHLATTAGILTSSPTYNAVLDTSGLNGDYCLNAIAEDVAANHSSPILHLKVTFDNIAPATPILTAPANNVVLTGTSITQSWTDSSSDVDHYIYESYNDAAASSLRWHQEYSGTSKTANNVSDTIYWWRVRAVDTAGNESAWSELRKITVDNTAPSTVLGVTIKQNSVNLGCNAYTTERLITVDWNDDQDVNFDHYNYQNRSGSTIQQPTVSQFTGNMSNADGYYKYRVQAVDKAGNTGQWSGWCGITLDRVAPSATITTPTGGTALSGTVTVSGNATDETLLKKFTWNIKNTGTNDVVVRNADHKNEASFSWDTTGVDDGTYRIRLVATDAAGNKTIVKVTVTVDNTPPTITFDSLASAITGIATFTGTASDNGGSGLRHSNTNTTDAGRIRLAFRPVTGGIVGSPVHVYFANVDGSGNWTLDVNTADSWFVDGQEYRVVARANDNTGTTYSSSNTSAQSQNTTIDNTAPTLTVDSSTGTNTTPTITGTTSDSTDAVTVDGQPATVSATVNGTGTYDWSYTPATPYPVGTTTITVVSTDAVGNSTSTTADVVVNSTPTSGPTPSTPTVTVTPTPQVLGASTTNDPAENSPSANGDNEKSAENVKGDSTTKDLNTTGGDTAKNVANNGSSFLGLGWWWLLVLAAALAGWWFIFGARRRKNEDN